jgi:hypothetical protein
MTFCDSRRKKQLYNVPLSRVEVVSPYYNSITGAQLVDSSNVPITRSRVDMRRKVEILKYSSNRMPAQTNSLTKKEKWSQIVNANGKSARLLDPDTVVCPGETSVRIPKPMPSSASGVPGPVVYLYEDPQVPLYNYIITRSYAYNVPNENNYWSTTINTNVGLTTNMISSALFAVNINANINRTQASFSLEIPVGLALKGTYTPNHTPPPSTENITLRVSSATLYVLCNGKSIPSVAPITITGLQKYMTCRITTSATTPVSFESIQYVGNLSFPNITLETSYAYVYEFVLSMTLAIETTANLARFNQSIGNTTTNTLQYYSYANLTNLISQTATNIAVISTSLGTVPNQPPPNPVLFGI